jgi:predicted NBD/HSP70 family sugar kinase
MKKCQLAVAALLFFLIGTAAADLQAQEVIEKAGVVTGVTVGNTIAIPAKAITIVIGALSGALSFIVTGGDTEVTKQVWRDTFEPPYMITPEVARMAVGQRPELAEQK